MIADVTATREWIMEGVSTTNEVKEKLETLYPDLRRMRYLIAVDNKIANTDTPLTAQAEVALLPPFSGG